MAKNKGGKKSKSGKNKKSNSNANRNNASSDVTFDTDKSLENVNVDKHENTFDANPSDVCMGEKNGAVDPHKTSATDTVLLDETSQELPLQDVQPEITQAEDLQLSVQNRALTNSGNASVESFGEIAQKNTDEIVDANVVHEDTNAHSATTPVSLPDTLHTNTQSEALPNDELCFNSINVDNVQKEFDISGQLLNDNQSPMLTKEDFTGDDDLNKASTSDSIIFGNTEEADQMMPWEDTFKSDADSNVPDQEVATDSGNNDDLASSQKLQLSSEETQKEYTFPSLVTSVDDQQNEIILESKESESKQCKSVMETAFLESDEKMPWEENAKSQEKETLTISERFESEHDDLDFLSSLEDVKIAKNEDAFAFLESDDLNKEGSDSASMKRGADLISEEMVEKSKFDFLEQDDSLLAEIMDDDLLDDDANVSVSTMNETVVVSESARSRYQPTKHQDYKPVNTAGNRAISDSSFDDTANLTQSNHSSLFEKTYTQVPSKSLPTNIIKPKKSIIELQEEKKKSDAYDFPQNLLNKTKQKPIKEVKENIYTQIETAYLRDASNSITSPPTIQRGFKASRSSSIASNKSFFAEFEPPKSLNMKSNTALKNPYAPYVTNKMPSEPYSTNSPQQPLKNPYAPHLTNALNSSNTSGSLANHAGDGHHIPPLKKATNPFAPAAVGGHVKQLSVTTVDPEEIKPNLIPVPTKQTLPLSGLSLSQSSFGVAQSPQSSVAESSITGNSATRIGSNKYAPTPYNVNHSYGGSNQFNQPSQTLVSPTTNNHSINNNPPKLSSLNRRPLHKPKQSVSSINDVYGSNIITSHATSHSTRKSTTLPPNPAKGGLPFTHPPNSFTPAPVVINPENLVRRQWPLFSFSGVGKVATMIPSLDGYSHNICKVHISDIKKYLKDDLLSTFPGPLIKNKTKRKDVVKFINDLISTNVNLETLTEAEELIWKCFIVMLNQIENKGDFSRKEYLNEISGILNSSLAHGDGHNNMFDLIEVSKIVQNFTPKKAFNAMKLDDDGYDQVQRYLENGNRKAALEFALGEGDWAMALIISQLMGNVAFSQVTKMYSMVNLPNSNLAEHLNFFIQTRTSNGNITEQLKGREKWIIKNIRLIVPFIMLDTTEYGGVLKDIGDALTKAGYRSYGKLMYILSGLPLIPQTLEEIPSSLTGMVIEEVYEYILSSSDNLPGNFPYGLPHILPLKVRHAGYLADIGLMTDAKRYCDNVHAAITSKHVFCEPTTIIEHSMVSERLSQTGSSWLSSKLSRPQLDRMWTTLDKSFNKFVSGEDLPPEEPKVEGVFTKFTTPLSLTRDNSNLNLAEYKNHMPYVSPREPVSTVPTLNVSTPNAPTNASGRMPSHTHGIAPLNAATIYPAMAHTPVHTTDSLKPASVQLNQGRYAPSLLNKPIVHSHQLLDEEANVNDVDTSNLINSVRQDVIPSTKTPTERSNAVAPANHPPPPHGEVNSVNAQSKMVRTEKTSHYTVTSSETSAHSGANAIHPEKLAANIKDPYNVAMSTSTVLDSADSLILSNELSFSKLNSPSNATETLNNVTGSDKPFDDVEISRIDQPLNFSRIDDIVEQINNENSKQLSGSDNIEFTTENTQGGVQTHPNGTEELNESVLTASNCPNVIQSADTVENSDLLTNEKGVEAKSIQPALQQPVPRVSTPQQVSNVEKSNNEQPSKSVSSFDVPSTFVPKSRNSSKKVNRYGPTGSVGVKKKPNPYANAYTPKSPSSNAYLSSSTDLQTTSDVDSPFSQSVNDIDMFSYNGYSVSQPSQIEESAMEEVDDKDGMSKDIDSVDEEELSTDTFNTDRSDTHDIPTYKPPTQIGVRSRKDMPYKAAELSKIFAPPSGLASRNISKTASPIHQFTEEKRYIAEDTGEYYDEVIDESDDEDDNEKDKAAQRKAEKEAELKRKEEEEEERKKKKEEEEESKKKAKNSKDGGWFGWIAKGKNDDKPKPIKAKLGEENSFYYDEKLKRWINKKQPLEEQLEAAKPPPPPAVKKHALPADKTTPSSLPSGTSGLSSAPPTKISSQPVSVPPTSNGAIPAKKDAIDDLLNINPGGASRKTGRRGPRRGYVDVMANK
ncbi:hypothetical protein CANINC_003971 [Pichia inconspicua]|uniref:Protein transport protein sec16 n=1 Tax=Pichia inconspicua TaxID=52247 RepID=A0A4T0WXD2_9ASCO|nr:hypothetical protein CANINC_003971 [[Candida] inconspicua]